MKTESIILGGGCFWCLEAAYQQVKGVVRVLPGYSGGAEITAKYDAVCTGETGHAQVVQVTFDPGTISLSDILGIFWIIHDPTSFNRQGADIGSQYASVIYYEGDEQKTIVEASRDEAQAQLDESIVTRIEPLDGFYEAEAYHHNYFRNNPEAGYCRAVIEPKLSKLREHFAGLVNND